MPNFALPAGRGPCVLPIEHNTVLRDDLLPRYSEVDPVATIFGYFMTCFFERDTTTFRFFPPDEYLNLEWRWRDLVDTNPDLMVAWHSDTPYSVGPIPLLHLHSMVTRVQYNQDGTVCHPPPWAADDLLTVEESLEMMTIDAAYALFRDQEIGSLATGKLADMIILPANPLDVDPDELLDMQVLMTMVGGETMYCAADQDAICP